MNNIDAIEAYRRCAARDLVEFVMTSCDNAEEYDQDAIVDALLDADPAEREFNSFRASDFWGIADTCRHAVLDA